MGDVVQRLADAGLEVPVVATPAGAYVPAQRSGGLVFTSGQLPMRDGVLFATGIVEADVSVDTARECARICALNAIAAAATVCDLDEVVCAVKLTGYVASTSAFRAQPTVIDGASEVLAIAFGEAGVHAREAVGVVALPLGAPVEVALVLEVR